MGTSLCHTQDSHSQPHDKCADQDIKVLNFQDFPREPSNWADIQRVKISLPRSGSLLGSRDLNFSISSQKCTSLQKQISQNKNEDKFAPIKTKSKNAMNPITFSTTYSQDLNDNETQNSQNALLSVIIFQQTEQRQQALDITMQYISSYVDETVQISIHKQQFIRVKKYDIGMDYRFMQKLGEGAFGQVYRCQHILDNQVRAVKILKKNILMSSKVKQQFLQEYNLLKKLDHPNIVKIYQIYQFNTNLYIVTQLCQGGTLSSYLKQSIVFSPSVNKQILKQLLTGVNYLHTKNIVHRDIKPDNIVFVNKLCADSRPQEVDLRIIDLGLAMEEKQKVFKDWKNIGTYSFMAPQIYNGVYSGKCDSWACGVVAHLLFLRNNPFRGFDFQQVKKKVHSYNPQTAEWDNIDSQQKHLLLSLIQPNYILRADVGTALTYDYFNVPIQIIDKQSMLHKLTNYLHINSLLSAAQGFLSFSKLSQTQQRQLSILFNQIDSNSNGIVDIKQFHNYLSNQIADDSRILHLFNKLDRDHSGFIQFSQFVMAMGCRKQLFNDCYLKQVYHFIDISRNNCLEVEELKYFLRTLSKSQINGLMEELDINQDGKVTFDQFKQYLLHRVF